MEIEYSKIFLNKLAYIKDDLHKTIALITFDLIPSIQNFKDIGFIKQIKGYTNYYKIRTGEYLIILNFDIEDNKLIFINILTENEVFNYLTTHF